MRSLQALQAKDLWWTEFCIRFTASCGKGRIVHQLCSPSVVIISFNNSQFPFEYYNYSTPLPHTLACWERLTWKPGRVSLRNSTAFYIRYNSNTESQYVQLQSANLYAVCGDHSVTWNQAHADHDWRTLKDWLAYIHEWETYCFIYRLLVVDEEPKNEGYAQSENRQLFTTCSSHRRWVQVQSIHATRMIILCLATPTGNY